MTRQRMETINGVLTRRQTTLTVLMENVHKPHNYSAVLRSCDAVGIQEAHAVATSELAVRHRAKHRMTSASAHKWVDVRIHRDIGEACGHLRGAGFRVVAAHLGEGARDFREYDYTQPTAILLGAERDGVSPEAERLADDCVVVPMLGMVQSLNVSVAGAVILFEAQRQRTQAGLYDTRHLETTIYERRRIEWMQPRIADYCRRRGLPYPKLDEEGEIIGDFRRVADDPGRESPTKGRLP